MNEKKGNAVKTTRAALLEETAPQEILVPERELKRLTRRDFLLYGLGAAAVAAGFFWSLPDDTHSRLTGRTYTSSPKKEEILNEALSLDDDVARALYSRHRMIPTYSMSQAQRELRNNYNGATPTLSDYLPGWTLTLDGLASGRKVKLPLRDIHALTARFGRIDQVTRLVCVEGWSMIAGWGGLRFADLIAAYPPDPDAKWASVESSVNLDSMGNSDPYYVSIDLPSALHPQTLLATYQNSPQLRYIPLTVENGAPVRLLAPMKLGLKNIKAITRITYTKNQPPDYWAERGYSKYDGI